MKHRAMNRYNQGKFRKSRLNKKEIERRKAQSWGYDETNPLHNAIVWKMGGKVPGANYDNYYEAPKGMLKKKVLGDVVDSSLDNHLGDTIIIA